MAFDFACPDWAERLADGRPPIPDLPLDLKAALRATRIFDNLRLPDVAGHPLFADACGDWFRALVRAVFGSIEAGTGARLVGEVFCLVPKKNSKTTYSAGLGITALFLNTVPNAEMLLIGPTKKQAETLFGQVCGIIKADPADPETGRSYLQDRFHIIEAEQAVKDRLTGARLVIKAFDMSVLTGNIPLLVIIDELHLMGGIPYARRVLAQIRGGMITRPDSLLIFITTQSDEPPKGVFKKELAYARGVRDGRITGGNMLAMLYEFPEALQANPDRPWLDPKFWPMVTPNAGRSITVPRLLALYRKALEDGPDEVTIWASQHLNIQVGMGKHDGGWSGADLWPAAARPMGLDEFLASVEVVTAGIDGGGLDDLLALALIGRHKESRAWIVWVRAWAGFEVLKRRKDIAAQLQDYAEDGDLVICADPTQDLRDLVAILSRVRDLGLLPKAHGIGLDPYGVAALVDELAAAGMEGELLAAIAQGTRLSPAVWGVERKLNDGTLWHAGQPLMDWCVGNAKTEQRGNAVMITKAVSGKAKIDPVMAMLNAFTLMSRNPDAAGGGLDDFLANPVMVI